MKVIAVAAAIAALCIPCAALAQAQSEQLKPERAENVRYWWVNMVKFHSGKRDRAGELVEKYFTPVDKEIGAQVIDVHMTTGEWDYITLFPMSGGPSDIGWLTSPDEVKFMNALAKRVGGMAAAKKLTDEFDSLVARRENHVAHTHP